MAKSPTPIPAPPVKIHRGAPGSTPARQRRRRKKVNPFVLFLRGLARRLYFGIKTAFKFLLFVPVLVFHGGVQLQCGPQRPVPGRVWHPAASST